MGRCVGCLFTEEEIGSIRKEYDFKERLKDTSVSDSSSIFTVHNLDTENSEEMDVSKSIVLAPYNTNESDEEELLHFTQPLFVSKRTIKFSSKLREVNRQYEKDNNSNIDNGIYVNPSDKLSKPSHKKADAHSKPKPWYLTPLWRSQIDKVTLRKMEEMGFEKSFVVGSLNANSHNSATTCYHLLAGK